MRRPTSSWWSTPPTTRTGGRWRSLGCASARHSDDVRPQGPSLPHEAERPRPVRASAAGRCAAWQPPERESPMISVFAVREDVLRPLADPDPAALPADALWVDLLDPTAEEEAGVERLLGVAVPTRAEMAEIEES